MKHIPTIFRSVTFFLLAFGLLAVAMITSGAFMLHSEAWVGISLLAVTGVLCASMVGYILHKKG